MGLVIILFNCDVKSVQDIFPLALWNIWKGLSSLTLPEGKSEEVQWMRPSYCSASDLCLLRTWCLSLLREICTKSRKLSDFILAKIITQFFAIISFLWFSKSVHCRFGVFNIFCWTYFRWKGCSLHSERRRHSSSSSINILKWRIPHSLGENSKRSAQMSLSSERYYRKFKESWEPKKRHQ